MLQRIQSLYMLASAIVTGALPFVFELWTDKNKVDVFFTSSIIYISLFVLAWIGQFYGHKVEGKKPSFFKGLQFLLIGPVWCMDAYLGKLIPKWKMRQKSQITTI